MNEPHDHSPQGEEALPPAQDEIRKERGARHSKSPLHRALNVVLVVLLATAAAFAGMLWQTMRNSGAIETLPIVTAPAHGAQLTPPPDLEPGEESLDDEPLAESEPDAYDRTPIYAVAQRDPDVLNILVLGLDTRTRGGAGRSDVNMIVSIRRSNGSVKLASVLRDTLVPIEDHGWNRLNAAYLMGGPGRSVNTVNQVLGTDVQRYVKLDFFTISDIIDAVGGVQVELTKAEVDWLRNDGVNIPKGAGLKQLDGAKALAYARIRKLDSDFQRTQRQRNVMAAALNNLRGMSPVQLAGLLRKLLPQVRTNIGSGEILTLATSVVSARGQDIEQLTIPVKGSFSFKKYKGMSIISADFNKNTQALQEFLYGE